MSKEYCMDCGMLLSPHTRTCSICGFDNSSRENPETAFRTDDPDRWFDIQGDPVPENYPGF